MNPLPLPYFLILPYLMAGTLLLANAVLFLGFSLSLSRDKPLRQSYLLFGLTSFFLSCFAFSGYLKFSSGNLAGHLYWGNFQVALLIPLTIVFFQFSAFHLGFTNIFYRWIMPLVSLAFLPLFFIKGAILQAHLHLISFTWLGREFQFFRVQFGPAAYPFLVWAFGNAILIGLLWIRHFLKNLGEFALFASFMLFLGSAINDLLITLRVYPGPPFFIFGFTGFLVVMAQQFFFNYLQVNRELEIKSRELETVNQEMRFLVESISHDLAGPLLTIQGFAELLKESGYQNPKELEDYLQRIKKNTDHMKALIKDLTDYLRIGRVEEKLEPVHLKQVLQQVLVLLDLPRNYPRSKVVLEGEESSFLGSSKRLKQVLLNLVQNALLYAGEDPALIHVTGKKLEKGVEIAVEDNGPGIPPEEQEKIFEPFYRAGQHLPGTGMGLAIVKKIVETYGGKVWIDSGYRQGTRVKIHLPNAVP